VLAMGLTWRDLVSSAAVVAMMLAFMAFKFGTDLPLLSSAWAASAVALVLGGICAVSAAGDLHTRPQPREGVIFRKVTTVLGAIALLAGLIALIVNSERALETLVVMTTFLWLTGTIWHVLTIGSES
jgi:hypothetical protein